MKTANGNRSNVLAFPGEPRVGDPEAERAAHHRHQARAWADSVRGLVLPATYRPDPRSHGPSFADWRAWCEAAEHDWRRPDADALYHYALSRAIADPGRGGAWAEAQWVVQAYEVAARAAGAGAGK